MSKKPRKNKLDPKAFTVAAETDKKKDKDWTFEDLIRSKTRRR